MTNILTAAEAAAVLRVDIDDAIMLSMLPQIDRFVINATGYDWTGDNTIREDAKSAARMLLVQWYENPAMIGTVENLAYGLTNALAQLESIGMRYRVYTFFGIDGAGGVALAKARIGDMVESLTGIYLSSGDQSSAFESTISVDGQIQQSSSSDLSEHKFRVVLKAADAVDP